MANKKVNGIFYVMMALLVVIVLGLGFTKAVESLNDGFYDGEKVVLNASADVLIKGRNFVKFDEYHEVGELAAKNNLIDAVSYYDPYLDKSVGYVNIFGGIGKNFVIIPGEEYEINVKSSGKLSIN